MKVLWVVFWLLLENCGKVMAQSSSFTTEDPSTTTEDEPPPIDDNTFDDQWLYRNFHSKMFLRLDDIDQRFPREYNALTTDERIDFTKYLGVLALYFRMHRKYVPHAIQGYNYAYPDGVGYHFDRSVTSHCTIFGWGIWSCVKSLYEAITEDKSNAWITSLQNVSLSAEYMASNLDPTRMERDLSIGQLLCHFTMRFEFFRRPIPYCLYHTLSDQQIRNGALPPNWNGELIALRFDYYDESYHDCAYRSFCPNPCEEVSEDGNLTMECPATGKKCEIHPEFNDDIIAMRHNDWNETCSCHSHHIYQKEVGRCVLQNFCRYIECPENEICINEEEKGRCICQLGFYRDKAKVCTSIGPAGIAWSSLAVSSAPHQSPLLLILFSIFLLSLFI